MERMAAEKTTCLDLDVEAAPATSSLHLMSPPLHSCRVTGEYSILVGVATKTPEVIAIVVST